MNGTAMQIELPDAVKGYVRGLTREQQDRLLTRPLFSGVGDCLMQVAEGSAEFYARNGSHIVFGSWDQFAFEVGDRFERVAPRATAILREYILELRAAEIVGPGRSEVPKERRFVPQLVAIGLAVLLVLL